MRVAEQGYLVPLEHGAGSSCRSLYALALMFPPKLALSLSLSLTHTHTHYTHKVVRGSHLPVRAAAVVVHHQVAQPQRDGGGAVVREVAGEGVVVARVLLQAPGGAVAASDDALAGQRLRRGRRVVALGEIWPLPVSPTVCES
jgi:hypothetical protein